MTYLVDANVLIARASTSHEFHERAKRWLGSNQGFAVCPITEGALVRFLKWQFPNDRDAAQVMLDLLASLPRYEFWADDLSYRDVGLDRIRGHKQVTDAYLVALARSKGGKLATFDEALAAIHSDVQLVTE